MKKITLLAVVFVAVSFASCKKDYTCSCTINGTTASGSETINDTKKKAKDACVAKSTTNVTCAIK